MDQKNSIGDLFRKAFSDFERKPSDQVWKNIEKGVNPTNVHKINYNKPLNYFIGSAAIVVISIILYFVLPSEPHPNTLPQAVNNQAIVNNQPIAIENEQNTVLPTEIKSEHPKNEVKDQNNFNTQDHTAKRQSIHDLIAQAEKNKSVTNDNSQHNDVSSTVVPKTTNVVSGQSTIQKQQVNKGNAILPENLTITPISFSPDQTICKGDKVKLSVNGGVSFLWSTGERTQYIIVNPSKSTDYSVIATDESGMRKTGLISITTADCNAPYIPNAFTPNGDGISDVFKVYGNDITKFELIIISRSGQIVYTSKNINEGWDGNSKGSPALTGIYVYTLKYTNELNTEQIITGHITLIR